MKIGSGHTSLAKQYSIAAVVRAGMLCQPRHALSPWLGLAGSDKFRCCIGNHHKAEAAGSQQKGNTALTSRKPQSRQKHTRDKEDKMQVENLQTRIPRGSS